MSKRNTRNVSFPCNKRRFRDKKEALYTLRHLEYICPEDHERPIRAYRCKACKGWHVTSKPYRPNLRDGTTRRCTDESMAA